MTVNLTAAVLRALADHGLTPAVQTTRDAVIVRLHRSAADLARDVRWHVLLSVPGSAVEEDSCRSMTRLTFYMLGGQRIV